MTRPETRTITVSGTGTVVVAPDAAEVEVSVEVGDDDPGAAYAQVSAVADRVLAVLDAQGVAAADRRTRSVSLGPRYEPGALAATGYSATHSWLIRVVDLAQVPAVLDGLVAAVGDALRLGSFTLTHSDLAEARARAEVAAVTDARARAQRLADAAHVALGAVIGIREDLPDGRRPATTLGWQSQSAGPVPVQPGTDTVVAHLSVTFALHGQPTP